ncbi:MAG TPA: carbohydrate kinase family protein [Terracidiphilus sp.]|nr:carbohydrate kinase family protein [Terracidiphilus sp.]
MKRYDVAVVGEIYVDHIFTGFAKWPEPGEEVFTNEYAQELGGGAAITACALGRLGRSVSLIGKVGEKEAAWIDQRLAGFGVSSEWLYPDPASTGVTVSVSSSLDRSFFTYVGANTELGSLLGEAAFVEHMTEARHVHFAMPIGAALAERILASLRDASCTTSLDVGHQAAWLSDGANLATCAAVDYMLPNEREAKLICRGDAQDYLEFTRRNNWPSGVVKMGSAGAIMRSESGALRAQALRVQTVDTTGAGDAFDAGFIDGLLDGEPGEECLRRGCVCGGLSTRVVGALKGLPARGELVQSYEAIYG